MIIRKYKDDVLILEEKTNLFTAEWCAIGPMSDPAYNLKNGEALHYFVIPSRCICGLYPEPTTPPSGEERRMK